MSRELRRALSPEDEAAEPGHFGCAMLSCNSFVSKTGRPVKSMRCSLGWALHSDLDIARCKATASSTDCWKLHPERTPVVIVPNGGEEPAAPLIHKIAGD